MERGKEFSYLTKDAQGQQIIPVIFSGANNPKKYRENRAPALYFPSLTGRCPQGDKSCEENMCPTSFTYFKHCRRKTGFLYA